VADPTFSGGSSVSSDARFVCVHGHFYQPPRENPWLDEVEVQDSARPWHDWNERVHAECYEPNTASRIVEPDGRIREIVNNYSRISFNFGPTLLRWLRDKAPDTYAAIRRADLQSRERYQGHGSALAQAYNHMILPLANDRDRETQVAWAREDFRDHFQRDPEGFWLPETAVDIPTLEVLARYGFRFTILAPHQAAQVRPVAGGEWQDVRGGRVDPTCAYRVVLPSGTPFSVFFYDGPISHAVAFERLLDNGERFARRLLQGFSGPGSEKRTWDPLVHIAIDGETFGHHHRHGDMALAYALHWLESSHEASLTNYGAYLERHPPDWEVEIVPGTSWSCAHGLGRWKEDCGCRTGARPEWHQKWRGPLREALDWLRDALAPRFEAAFRELGIDPWEARQKYIRILNDPSEGSRARFLAEIIPRSLSSEETVRAWKLLEMQRHALLMYTSCGWFFDDISGVEAVQVLEYAARALQLAQELFGVSLQEEFLSRLERAPGNLEEYRNGRLVFEKLVTPMQVDLLKVVAHYAANSLFESIPTSAPVYAYDLEELTSRRWKAADTELRMGVARVRSRWTQETADLSFGVLYLGGLHLEGGVRTHRGPEAFDDLARRAGRAFEQGSLAEVFRILATEFDGLQYSLSTLFREEQRRVVGLILRRSLEEAEGDARRIYRTQAPLVRFLAERRAPLPPLFRATAEFILQSDLRRAMELETPDLPRVGEILEEIRQWDVPVTAEAVGFAPRRAVERSMERLRKAPEDLGTMEFVLRLVQQVRQLPYTSDLWRAQNYYFELARDSGPRMKEKAASGDEAARRWSELFAGLGQALGVKVD
jgi:alpha-amylase/alpha-mannosidase (GH57 family)